MKFPEANILKNKLIKEAESTTYIIYLSVDEDGQILKEADSYGIVYEPAPNKTYKFSSTDLNKLKTFLAYGFYPYRPYKTNVINIAALFGLIEQEESLVKESLEDDIEFWGVVITLDGKQFDMIASFPSEDAAYEYIEQLEQSNSEEGMYGFEYDVVNLKDDSAFEYDEDEMYEIEEIENE